MLESLIKRKVRERLEKSGWLVLHLITTNKNGIPDTMILRKGDVFFIEFKQPGKNPAPLQEYRINELRKQGFVTIVVRGVEDINHLF